MTGPKLQMVIVTQNEHGASVHSVDGVLIADNNVDMPTGEDEFYEEQLQIAENKIQAGDERIASLATCYQNSENTIENLELKINQLKQLFLELIANPLKRDWRNSLSAAVESIS